MPHHPGRRRTDRGEPTLTTPEIEEFCRAREITGGYVGTRLWGKDWMS